MRKISMCRPDAESTKLVEAISEVTGISIASLRVAEKAAVAKRSFRPLRGLLENAKLSRANRLKYRVGLKQACKKSRRMGTVLANKIELTITTDRGALNCEADVYVVMQQLVTGEWRQNIHLEVRYSIYRGLRKQQFRQSLKLTAKPKQRYMYADTKPVAEWTFAA